MSNTDNLVITQEDIAKREQFFRAFNSVNVWILTAIPPNHESPPQSKAFKPDDIDGMQAWVKSYGDKGWNIYFQVNPSIAPTDKKSLKANIKSGDYLFIDIDPANPVDATDKLKFQHYVDNEHEDDKRQYWIDEKARCLELIKTGKRPESVPTPTFILDSGNGYHAYWKLETPFALCEGELASASDELITEYEAYNKKLIDDIGADKVVFNVDRILRMPYTINVPNKKKAAMGRVRIKTSVVYPQNIVASNVYPLEAFCKVETSNPNPSLPVQEPAPTAEQDCTPAPPEPTLDAELSALGIHNARELLAYDGKGCPCPVCGEKTKFFIKGDITKNITYGCRNSKEKCKLSTEWATKGEYHTIAVKRKAGRPPKKKVELSYDDTIAWTDEHKNACLQWGFSGQVGKDYGLKPTMERFDSNTKEAAIVFPYITDGITLNYKFRSASGKKFSVRSRDNGGRNGGFFAWDIAKNAILNTPKGEPKTLIIVEGEKDVLSIATATGLRNIVSAQYGGITSLTDGNLQKIEQYKQWIDDNVDTIILAMENDIDAPARGKKNIGLLYRNTLTEWFGYEKCKVVDWTQFCGSECGHTLADGTIKRHACGDANDVLLIHGAPQVSEALANAKQANKPAFDEQELLLGCISNKEADVVDVVAAIMNHRYPKLVAVFDPRNKVKTNAGCEHFCYFANGSGYLTKSRIDMEAECLDLLRQIRKSVVAMANAKHVIAYLERTTASLALKADWDVDNRFVLFDLTDEEKRKYSSTRSKRYDPAPTGAYWLGGSSLNPKGDTLLERFGATPRFIENPTDELLIQRRLPFQACDIPRSREEFEKTPCWSRLQKWFSGDEETIRRVGFLYATAFIENPERAFVLNVGPSGSGKSSILYLARKMLSSYFKALPQDAIIAKGRNGHDTHSTKNKGLDSAFIAGLGDAPVGPGYYLLTGAIKQLTGGDLMAVRGINENNTDVENTAMPMMCANNGYIPTCSEVGTPIDSRFHLIPFLEAHKDLSQADLHSELEEAGPAFFYFLMTMLEEYRDDWQTRKLPPDAKFRFPPCPRVDNATRKWLRSEDGFGSDLDTVLYDGNVKDGFFTRAQLREELIRVFGERYDDKNFKDYFYRQEMARIEEQGRGRYKEADFHARACDYGLIKDGQKDQTRGIGGLMFQSEYEIKQRTGEVEEPLPGETEAECNQRLEIERQKKMDHKDF